MKHIKIFVIVPSVFAYRLASSFSSGRIDAFKRKNIEIDVVRLIDTDIEDNDKEAIVLDSRPSSSVHLHIPEHIFSYLSNEEMGYLLIHLRYQCSHIDPTDAIFCSDLRSMFEYFITHFSDLKHTISNLKFFYATVGLYQHIDEKSIKYLKDVIEECSTNGFCHEALSSDMLGTSYYLLAREEADKQKKNQLLLRALAYNEFSSLDHNKFPDHLGVIDYALTMIEVAEIINDTHYDHAYNGAYEMAIFIMKRLLDSVCQSILNLESPELRRCNIEYFKVQVNIVERRLSEKAPSEFHGQIEKHFNNLNNNQNHG